MRNILNDKKKKGSTGGVQNSDCCSVLTEKCRRESPELKRKKGIVGAVGTSCRLEEDPEIQNGKKEKGNEEKSRSGKDGNSGTCPEAEKISAVNLGKKM